MLVKAIFLIVLVIFSVISSLIDLPPGTILTETLKLSIDNSSIITNNLINGIFFATLMATTTYIIRRKNKVNSTPATKRSSTDYKTEKILYSNPKIDGTSNLTQINGIGPKNAIDLELAGVTTIADLAKRSPKHLAEKTGIPITRVSKWIVDANKIISK